MERLKQKQQEGDDMKLGRRNELLGERERLEGLLVKAEGKVQ